MSIEMSHVWKKLKNKTRKDWDCYFCKMIIKKGTKNVWIYKQPYRKEYVHNYCIELRKRKLAKTIINNL